jgi:hypothetical protein
MKHLLIYTSALALLAGTMGSVASAGDRGGFRHHHGSRSRIIIQQPSAVGSGLGLAAIVGLSLLAQAKPAPLVFPDDPAPEPKRYRAPVEPKLRNPIPMK